MAADGTGEERWGQGRGSEAAGVVESRHSAGCRPLEPLLRGTQTLGAIAPRDADPWSHCSAGRRQCQNSLKVSQDETSVPGAAGTVEEAEHVAGNGVERDATREVRLDEGQHAVHDLGRRRTPRSQNFVLSYILKDIPVP